MGKSHDELLAAAVEAHRRFEAVAGQLEEARKGRQRAFREAFRGPVKGREIAEATGLSESFVSRIKTGDR